MRVVTKAFRSVVWGVLAGVVAVLLLGDAAGGEEAPAPKQVMEIEKITVTAEKREEDIQETPISMQAFTAETIEEKGISTIEDLGQYTPNVHMHPNAGGSTGMTVNMRGAITSDPIITLEPAVGIYMNGVYVAKSVGSLFDMTDVERIEVLRGPQGTLYGRNTVGGAISLIPKRPEDRVFIGTSLDIGDYDYFQTATTVNVPLLGDHGGFGKSDQLGKLATRATISYRTRDDFFTNRGTGSDGFDDLNRAAANVGLLWEPRDDLSFDYNYDYHYSREQQSAFQLSGVRPSGPTVFLAPYVLADRAHAMSNNAALAPDGTTHDLANDLEVRGHAFTSTYDAGELGPFGKVKIKSITGYRSLSQFEVQDLDGTPIPVANTSLHAQHQGISEELQWLGTAGDGRIEYVMGFFFYDEKGGERNPQVFFGGTPFVSSLISTNAFSNKSYAPFGQATWTPPILSDKLSVTAGLRYTYEDKSADRDYQCLVGQGQPCSLLSFKASGSKSFDAVTPMGNIAYQWTDDVMSYARISRGFKSGGFNGRASTAATFLDPFQPETLTSYELGIKSQWLDNRLQLNVAGFYSDYQDLQVTVFRADPILGAVTTLENAAAATIYGTEVEAVAQPVKGLQLRVGYGYLHPEYDEFCESHDPVTGRCTADVANQRSFVLSPKHTVTTGIGYTAPPTPCGVVSAALDAYWQDDVVFAAKDNNLDGQSAYAVLNGRLQLSEIPVPEGSLSVALWARNLTDTKYRTFGIDFGALGYAGNTYGNPRLLGVNVTYKWGRTS
ncbi:MAG: TonB-dependent receptor [Candidatus Binatia bacterium]